MDFEDKVGTGCPECGSANVRRSHRKNSVEIFLSERMHRDPFRCENCLARFFRYREGDPAQRVYRASAQASTRVATQLNHGQSLQKRRRVVLGFLGGVSALLFILSIFAFRAGVHKPVPRPPPKRVMRTFRPNSIPGLPPTRPQK